MKILSTLKKLFLHTHKYKFIQAWEAQLIGCKDKNGKYHSLLMAINNDPIVNEEELSSLLMESKKQIDIKRKKRYLINLQCKCGNRITIEDTIYFPDNYV